MIVNSTLVFTVPVHSSKTTTVVSSSTYALVRDVRDSWAMQTEVRVNVTSVTPYYGGAYVYDGGLFRYQRTGAALVTTTRVLSGQAGQVEATAYVTEVLTLTDKLLDPSVQDPCTGGGTTPTSPSTTYYWG